MSRRNEQPFFRKLLSLFSETNLPFSEKGCSFFSPPPEWLERVAVWVCKCHASATQVSLKNERYRTVYQRNLSLVVPSVTPYNSFL